MEKVIHYCWFGGNPLGSKELKCIDSWRKFLPDYEVKRWDESNFDVHCCDYVSEAYAAKKWAFVSDYVRFWVLFREGGLYFDTDVEVVQPIDDLIEGGPFMGFEKDFPDPDACVAPGLVLFAPPGLDIYRKTLESYEQDHFVLSDGSYNLQTSPRRLTEILLENGLRPQPGVQKVGGVTIFPAEYFNPKDFETRKIHLTPNTRTIHHFDMSWVDEKKRFHRFIVSWLLRRGLPERISWRVASLVTIIRFYDVGNAYRRVVERCRRLFTKDRNSK